MGKYTLQFLKRRAKKIKKELNITHTEALELVAKEDGYENWKDLLLNIKNN